MKTHHLLLASALLLGCNSASTPAPGPEPKPPAATGPAGGAVTAAVEVGKLDGLQKRLPAKVVRFPFYDPEKKRPRS